MAKRKKKQPVIIDPTDKCTEYLQLWLELQDCHESEEFDETRRAMNSLWHTMNNEDKKCFARCTNHAHR